MSKSVMSTYVMMAAIMAVGMRDYKLPISASRLSEKEIRQLRLKGKKRRSK